jgi:SAM-dependent methyltransferase
MGKPTNTVGHGPEYSISPVFGVGMLDDPISFTEMGLDRTQPAWVMPMWERPVLHLGPGNKHIDLTEEYDWPEWDFDKINIKRFPYNNGECGGVIATHVLEHLKDPRPLLREVGRILAPGAPFSILVPHGQSLMFLQDLDHKTAFVIETWKTLLNNPYYIKEHDGFPFEIGANFIWGFKEDNLSLVTQLIKKG